MGYTMSCVRSARQPLTMVMQVRQNVKLKNQGWEVGRLLKKNPERLQHQGV
jgi:hypothetical protein